MKKTMLTSLVAFLLLATTSYGQVLSSAHSVYFGSGSSVLTAEAKTELTTIATRVKDKSELKAIIWCGFVHFNLLKQSLEHKDTLCSNLINKLIGSTNIVIFF